MKLNGPCRIRIQTTFPLLLHHFSLFEKHRGPRLGPQTHFAENISDFEPVDCNDELQRSQHPRILLGKDATHLSYKSQVIGCQRCSSQSAPARRCAR